MRRCLRDPTFSRFDTIPECDRQTHTHTHRHTTTAYTALSIASRGKQYSLRQNDLTKREQKVRNIVKMPISLKRWKIATHWYGLSNYCVICDDLEWHWSSFTYTSHSSDIFGICAAIDKISTDSYAELFISLSTRLYRERRNTWWRWGEWRLAGERDIVQLQCRRRRRDVVLWRHGRQRCSQSASASSSPTTYKRLAASTTTHHPHCHSWCTWMYTIIIIITIRLSHYVTIDLLVAAGPWQCFLTRRQFARQIAAHAAENVAGHVVQRKHSH